MTILVKVFWGQDTSGVARFPVPESDVVWMRIDGGQNSVPDGCCLAAVLWKIQYCKLSWIG